MIEIHNGHILCFGANKRCISLSKEMRLSDIIFSEYSPADNDHKVSKLYLHYYI